MNVLIYFCILIIMMVSIYVLLKSLNKQGLNIIMILTNILSLITSYKIININNYILLSNSILYVTLFAVFYLLIEKSGKKEIKKIINTNIILSIFSIIILLISTFYTQSITDTIGINMKNLFINNYRILIAYPVVLSSSLYLINYLYQKFKYAFENIIITCISSYMIVSVIDIFLFIIISYYKYYDNLTLMKIFLSTYMIRLILITIYTFFMILLTKKKVKK